MAGLTVRTEHENLQPLTPRELSDILARNNFGHLGCASAGEVYVVPINYALDGDYIYAHSRYGHKVEMLRRAPRLCLEVEEIDDVFNWRSVIVWGRFEELRGEDAAKAMRSLLRSYGTNQPKAKMSALEMDFANMAVDAVFFRFRIERMTGRREGC